MDKYTRNKEIIDGELDDNQVMMDIKNGKYFGLNKVGKHIWEFIEEPKTMDAIIQYLLGLFDVSEKQCAIEVKEFVAKILKLNVIIKI